jgi:ribosomal protein L7/L12
MSLDRFTKVNSPQMSKVIIIGWRKGLQKIPMTKLVQKYTSLGLSEAKSVTDRVLNGEVIVLTVNGDEEAASLVEQLKAIGAEAFHEAV